MLSAHYWQSQQAITGTAQGRGTTYFLQYEQQPQWVLRHYYRGGLIGKLIKDTYLFTGIKNTRAAKEFLLLESLQALNLPAPKPVAFRVIKNKGTYQADLLSQRIENAQDLVEILTQKVVSNELWHKVGQVIKRFHNNGVYHHDLNAHNILIDTAENVWIIDFDRGEIRKETGTWQQENMARFKRSLEKEKMQLSTFYWEDKNWQQLLNGYQLKA